MRYSLRTLLFLVTLTPPLLAGFVWAATLEMRCGCSLRNAAQCQATLLVDAVKVYHLHTGQLPTDLSALITPPASSTSAQHWNGPYLERKSLPLDPWNNSYHYRIIDSRAAKFRVWSPGPDQITPSQDDIEVLSN